jgi:Mlc titration factor MtfA (ptsG expression regulator)
MFFSWLRKRRRRRILAEPFPDEWRGVLESNVVHYGLLPPELQEKLRGIIQVLVAEKDWAGCRGLAMTVEIKVTLAALAGILILGQDDFYFDNVLTVLVYPSGYRARRRHGLGGEAFIEGMEELEGEADPNGPITLSWNSTLEAARQPGYGSNLVFHEFAHKVDMLAGEATGKPPMPRALEERWDAVMPRAYRNLVRAVEQRRKSFLDPYGATNEAEFFAVVTEAFFDDPLGLRAGHAELYEVFRELYRLDPATWFESGDLARDG